MVTVRTRDETRVRGKVAPWVPLTSVGQWFDPDLSLSPSVAGGSVSSRALPGNSLRVRLPGEGWS